MDEATSHFQSKSLRPSGSTKQYQLYKAALEWDLLDPIVIEKREDLKSEQLWKDTLEPYHHQVSNLITFCRRLPVTLLADDVGLGKTISAGLIMSELISRNRIAKILIVCPKLLLPQWEEELRTKFGIPSVAVAGAKLKTAEPPEEVGAVITTYHSARLYLNDIAKRGFDMLILDEAHKLRNLYGVDPPPQVAQRFRKALADRLFKYVLMLTATPIQNRLWDLYSLVDLLTVARGHQNPFGSEGMFARKFIADSRTTARQLNQDNSAEFRSVVYGYMSRVRRADANLYFPDRKVQLHTTDPTPEELEIIKIISKPIQKLNRLAQISILQALISSPHALSSQLTGMANRGTVPSDMAAAVKRIVDRPFVTAKLRGLEALVDKLQKERPEQWRMIVFTGRRETQTTIQAHLEEKGIRCGLINGDSALRNQEAIAKLKQEPPAIHVIISTDAGSEGVNLQAANVLVNYDLPWNPMIVEQRIGRIQRLASNYASVAVFNIVLRGTFEEYIVGRLMEKLQMASHAIGDIEALLEASGIDDADESKNSFEEQILSLVLASLSGKNVEEATRKAIASIDDAKAELDREQSNIDTMLGGIGGSQVNGPESPHLPVQNHTMEERSFVLSALHQLGAHVTQHEDGVYISESQGKKEWICFEREVAESGTAYTLYKHGSPAFSRLVSRITHNGLHVVEDVDQNPASQSEKICRDWMAIFGGTFRSLTIDEVKRCFDGVALVRVRATVAHDSYERLVEARCIPSAGQVDLGNRGLEKVSNVITSLSEVGLSAKELVEKAKEDFGITEFCRFYNERRIHEVGSAGDDARKQKKLEDDFTPRLEFELVGLSGSVYRQLRLSTSYCLDSDYQYTSKLTTTLRENGLIEVPKMGECSLTGKIVPVDSLERCSISNRQVIKERLVKSEISNRWSLPEHRVLCALSGKHVLTDEVEKSDVTGQLVTRTLLRTSTVSGKRAEPQYFGKCEFTSSDALENELAVSENSGKRYRVDEQLRSAVSGKAGHKHEFVYCSETKKPLLPTEAEKCEVTGKIVLPGILEECELTGKRVLPSELERSTISGRKALRKFFVSSALSGARLLEHEAVKSVSGKYCAPIEAKTCHWGGRKCYPDDVRTDELTGLQFHFEYISDKDGQTRLVPLSDLLDGLSHKSDMPDLWPTIVSNAITVLGNKHSRVEGAELSPDKKHIAVCLEVKMLMGLKKRHSGLLYSVEDESIVGRVRLGKRGANGWTSD